MKRMAYQQLRKWHQKKDRKPLIVRGARQVGKTYLLKAFAKAEFKQAHYFNFEGNAELCQIFERNLDPERIIAGLSYFQQKPINTLSDFVIFDEIQSCPKALTSLKYFNEQMGELALCAAGSLLGVHLASASFPVGQVDWLELFPLNFEEFLLGVGDAANVDIILNATKQLQISQLAHQRLWDQLKNYFIVGGLPEAVVAYQNHMNTPFEAFAAVREKQTALINTYYADIAKHSGKVNAMHIDRVWKSVPSQLMASLDASANKYKFKGVLPGIARYSGLVNALDWLEKAGLILKSHIVAHAELPLSAFVKANSFKLFMFDVGLLGAMSGLSVEAILKYDYGTYKGYFAENFVAQELIAAFGAPLFNWHENTSEIEFLHPYKATCIPIEVKAGNIAKLKSLKVFREKYHPEVAVILSGRNLLIDKMSGLMQLPLYLASQITKYIT